MKTFLIIILVVVIGAAVYFSMNRKSAPAAPATTREQATQNPQPQASQTGAQVQVEVGAQAPQPVSVAIKNFAFSPATLSVKAGTKVTWTNNDSMAHTVTADSGLFDSGTIAPGASFSFTFASVGTVSYHCNFHPSMKGSVAVSQ